MVGEPSLYYNLNHGVGRHQEGIYHRFIYLSTKKANVTYLTKEIKVEKYIKGLNTSINPRVEMVEPATFDNVLDLDLKRDRSMGMAPSNNLVYEGLNQIGFTMGVANHQTNKLYPSKGNGDHLKGKGNPSK